MGIPVNMLNAWAKEVTDSALAENGHMDNYQMAKDANDTIRSLLPSDGTKVLCEILTEISRLKRALENQEPPF